MNIKELSDNDLESLFSSVVDERRRRTVLATAAQQSAILNREYRSASGQRNDDP